MSKLQIEPQGLNRLFRDGISVPGWGQQNGTDDHRGVVLLIKGDPGTGKTTLAIQMALTAENLDYPGTAPGVPSSPADVIDKVSPEGSAASFETRPTRRYYSCEQTVCDLERRTGEIAKAVSRVDGGRENRRAYATEDIEFHVYSEDCRGYAWESCAPYQSSFDVYNWLDGKIAEIGRKTEGEPWMVTVLDGMNLLYKEEREMVQVQRLMENMRRTSRLGIIILEGEATEHPFQEFMADIVIEMKSTSDNVVGYLLHKLSITKSRYQETALGWHQYKNRHDGIAVFPSIHYWTSQTGSVEERMEMALIPLSERGSDLGEEPPGGDDEKPDPGSDIITQMIGHERFNEGSCTVLLGPRRTLKTELCLDFLRGQAVGDSSGKSLLVTLLDNQGTVLEQRRKLCARFGACLGPEAQGERKIKGVTLSKCKSGDDIPPCWRCFGSAHAFHFRPGCITPEELMNWLDNVYRKLNFRRLVFWDLTQMESRFPLLAFDNLFLPLLVDWLANSPNKDGNQEKKVTSLFMGSPNTQLGRMAAAIADNVIFTWRDRPNNPESSKTEQEQEEKTEQEQEGVAVYLDRAQGRSSDDSLWWLGVGPEKDGRMLDDQKRVPHELVRAGPMIDRIQAMQGFEIADP